MQLTVVPPDRENADTSQISILSPIGMALFGYASGDHLNWGPLERPIRVLIDRVVQTHRPRP